ncbi:MAG: ATP-binding protein [Phocaeicola plebeius]|nr:ATP-binding protein [Phocaeicola plebeius]
MEKLTLKRCPLGIQTFEIIREGDYLYVDKTDLVYRMTHDYTYVFLSRPRRFGKSLLASTLHSYFAGRKDLFTGLAIEGLEKEWTKHPVLHFDMSTAKHLDRENLERELSGKLTRYEDIYGKGAYDQTNLNQRLEGLIRRAYEQTAQKVVVLIDEYDAPLLDVVHEEELLPQLRQVMRNFYSPLKACDPYLRFVFLTGITKFSQMSIFSELNNLVNISMDPEYGAICGITQEELLTVLTDYTAALGESQEFSYDETVETLRRQYDGYHFAWPSSDLFNPFSLLNALARKRIDNYWFSSGTPTYLIEMMRKFDVQPSQVGPMEAFASDFDAPTESMTSLVPLLYQSGYLTIKGYNRMLSAYTLDIPNKEIRIGLLKSLLPHYVNANTIQTSQVLMRMYECLMKDDLDGMLRLLQQYLLTIPQCDHTDYEGHYQQVLYILLSLLGTYVDVEVRTATGRVDMVMRTYGKLYLFELKLGRSAAPAMEQINLKDYPARFALSGLPVVKVGISFDTERHTISDWKIEDNQPKKEKPQQPEAVDPRLVNAAKGMLSWGMDVATVASLLGLSEEEVRGCQP